jgi:3-hydroxy-3-methylglutaryl CoA synthase
MSHAYTREQIFEAVNAGAGLVIDEFALGERDEDIVNLVVNAAMTVLDKPDADMAYVVEECYSEPLEEIKDWWDFS